VRTTALRWAAALLALGLASCSSEKVLSEREYHESATAAMKEEVYDLAIKDFQKLLEEYPFSDYSEEAQLKIGQAQYLSKQYAESIASFQDFQRMHPTNQNIALTEYYTALAYMDQMGTKDRDQRAAENAQIHLQTVIARYPDSPYAAEAKRKLKECRNVLADHEFAIAKFYLVWTDPLGAEARLRRLLENYPDTDIAPAALAHFGKYFLKRGDLTRSALAYASLIGQYPQSPDVPEAQSALAELKAKKIEVPDPPLPALVESLGRPSLASTPQPAAAPPSPAETAASPPPQLEVPPDTGPGSAGPYRTRR
jgi:outer membrane protein assembly factor BamD